MKSRPRPQRSVRVEDEIWFPAHAAAQERGEVLSEEIREFLIEYTQKTPARPVEDGRG